MPKTKIEETKERQANDWVDRESKKNLRANANEGVHLVKDKNPLVQAANEVFRKKALRRVN